MKPKSTKDVLLLDTNIWRYIADSQAEAVVRRGSISNKVAIAIAPAALYEALRTPDPALRLALVRTMTSRSWKRLMPEAYDEAEELLSEMRRLCPRWLLATPKMDRYWQQRYDWMRSESGFWDRARYDSAGESRRLSILEADMLPKAREAAYSSRELFSDAMWRFEKVNLKDIRGTPVTAEGKVIGPKIDAWRAISYGYYSSSLRRRCAHRDWLAPRIDIGAVLGDSYWRDFWFVDVEDKRLPRAWLRWAFELLHSLRRVNDGTPCDSQIGSYSNSCSHIVTADKRLANVIEKCRESAPFPIAKAILVSSGENAVKDLLELMTHLSGQRRNHHRKQCSQISKDKGSEKLV